MYSLKEVVLWCVATALLTLAAYAALWPVAFQPANSHLYPTPIDVAEPEGREEVRLRHEEIVARRDTDLERQTHRELMKLIWRMDLWKNMYWLGIPVLKSPSDMWMTQQVIAEVRPDYIIEAGSYQGGSALYFAHVLEGLGLPDAKVITIDIRNTVGEASALPLWRKRVRFVHGSSTDPKVVAAIAEQVHGKKVLVVLDSDHSKSHVLAELEAYAPLVSPGSYIIAEDTSLDGIPLDVKMANNGPMAAVEAFLGSEAGSAFSPDTARESLVVTFHPGGWLRRSP